MFISTKRGARLVAIVGLTAAVGIGLAAPASAAPGDNSGTGIVAAGLVNAGPFSQAFFPTGPVTNTLVSANVPGLVSSGTIVTNASGTTADATVQDLSVTLSALATLAATAVSSQCSYDTNTAMLSGSSSIAGGVITILGGSPITLAASPAANTSISVPGVATITLNRQVIAPDGSLTVDAIFIDLLNSTQTVTIATSVCQAADLAVPVIAPQFAAGAGVLGLLVLGFVLYRRRQSALDAA